MVDEIPELPLSPDDRHEVLAAARDAGAMLQTPVEDLIGFVSAVRRKLGFHPTEWAGASHAEVLAELDYRLRPPARPRFAASGPQVPRRGMTDGGYQ